MTKIDMNNFGPDAYSQDNSENNKAASAQALEEANERVHFAEGTAELAIRHRNEAERRCGEYSTETVKVQDELGALLHHAEAQRDALVKALEEITEADWNELREIARNALTAYRSGKGV